MPPRSKKKSIDYEFRMDALSGINADVGVKWFNTSPEVFKDSSGKRKSSVRDMSDSEDDSESIGEDNDSEPEHETTSRRRTQKKAKGNKKKGTNDTTAAPETEQWANYVKIICEKLPTTQTNARNKNKASNAPAEVIKDRGVFFGNMTMSFDDYLGQLADNVPCKRASLIIPQLYWRFDKPMNGARKTLKDAASYKAMLMSIAERSKDRVVLVYMPVPKEDNDIVPWDTGRSNQIDFVDFEAGMEADISQEDASIAEKQAALLKGTGEYMDQLRNQYPVDPATRIRVYTDKTTGDQWELTDLRLQVWSANMAKGPDHATLYQPPMSTHFHHKARIHKPVRSDAPVQVLPASSSAAVAIPTTNPLSNMTELLTLAITSQLMQQQNNFNPVFNTRPPLSGASAPSVLPQAIHKPAAETLVLPRPITLSEFCVRYQISKSDLAKLEKLEVELSDPQCLDLEKEVWKGDGGFSELGWMRFKDKYLRFRVDIANDLWN